MKKFFLSLCVVLSMSVPAFASEHLYGSVSAFGVFQNHSMTNYGTMSMENGLGFGGAIGAKVTPMIDTEVEYVYRNVGPTMWQDERLKGDWTTHSVMTNAYVKPLSFHQNAFIPYVGGGLGVAFHQVEFDSDVPWQDTQATFAYQVMAGTYVDVGLGPQVKVGYRMFSSGDAALNGIGASYLNHNVEVGIRF